MRAKYARIIRIGVIQGLRDSADAKAGRTRHNMKEFDNIDRLYDLRHRAWSRAFWGQPKSVNMSEYGWKDK